MGEKQENFELSEAEKVSPTAHLVAYLRTFSDIPYSEQFAELTNSKDISAEWSDQLESLIHRAPIFEARFKGVSDLIKETGAKNILEIAAGVSPRGLIMSEDPSITYIETDLPDMARKMSLLVNAIEGQGGGKRDNLRVLSADALSLEALQTAASSTSGEIAFAGEGLLLYLNNEKKDKLADNIRKILEERGGWWITDTSLKSEYNPSDQERVQVLKNVADKVGVNIYDVAFDDDNAFENYIRRNGLRIEKEVDLITYLDKLTCTNKLSLDPQRTDQFLRGRKLYRLTLG